MHKILLAVLLMFLQSCPAAELAPTAKDEIAHLISYLENSGCQFNRNGSWFGAKEAVAHISRKYEYLLDKGLVSSAEAFIDRAATESSLSGRPYLVMCGAGAPIESAMWFKAELASFRAHHLTR